MMNAEIKQPMLEATVAAMERAGPDIPYSERAAHDCNNCGTQGTRE